jgi:hypothetical protein
LEIGEVLLVVLDQSPDSVLSSGWDLLPQLVRDWRTRGHPGWQDVDAEEGGADDYDSGEDELSGEDLDVSDLDADERDELARSGRAREEMPVAMMGHASRRRKLSHASRPARPITPGQGKALALEQLRASKFFATKPREGTARLSHGRKTKDSTVSATRGHAAAAEIAATCPFLT